MTESTDTMVSSEVEVAVDPDIAFTAFTSELDLWWVRGPINHFAGGRALAMRCEPGVGGRLLEVYEDVDDIDAHYQRARAAGATIVTEPASPWGLAFYVADDLEGNRWTFAQARPTKRS